MFTASSGFARLRESTPHDTTQQHDFNALVNNIRQTFSSGKTLPYEWRIAQLGRLEKMLMEGCDEIIAAVKKDLGRPDSESLVGEVGVSLDEVRFAMQNLKKWMAPEHVSQPPQLQPGKSVILRQPKGVVLIISPWNFPIYLALAPLVAAISAGCCSVIKPSEMTPTCSAVLQRLIESYLDLSCIAVVQGGVTESTALLELRFDHIFYTGNSSVARVVLTAAAKHLTPCTLELGGKSPVIIDDSVNLKVACRRIIAGKCMNAGQVCVAPDFVLCSKSMQPRLVAQLKETLNEMYGTDTKASGSLGRIVNSRHWERVAALIRDSGGNVEVGGLDQADKQQLFVPPTIITDVDRSSKIMQEEIFGPVLPIVTTSSVDESIGVVNSIEKPLALYVFSSNSQVVEHVLANTNAGGSCVNDTVFQIVNPNLPFGGVGLSGMGAYHGKHGFEEFSHRRSVMYRSTWVDPSLRYAPYTEKKMALFRRVLVGPFFAPTTVMALKATSGAAAIAVLLLVLRWFKVL